MGSWRSQLRFTFVVIVVRNQHNNTPGKPINVASLPAYVARCRFIDHMKISLALPLIKSPDTRTHSFISVIYIYILMYLLFIVSVECYFIEEPVVTGLAFLPLMFQDVCSIFLSAKDFWHIEGEIHILASTLHGDCFGKKPLSFYCSAFLSAPDKICLGQILPWHYLDSFC